MLTTFRADAVKVWYLVGADTPDLASWQARLRVAATEARRANTPLIVHADLVVLERNPLEDISHVRTVRQVVRGGRVWTREELEYR